MEREAKETKDFQGLMRQQNEDFQLQLVASRKRFKDAENQRDYQFVREQEERRNETHRLSEDILAKFAASETRRTSNCVRWDGGTRRSVVMQMQTWKSSFEAGERRRDELLNSIIINL